MNIEFLLRHIERATVFAHEGLRDGRFPDRELQFLRFTEYLAVALDGEAPALAAAIRLVGEEPNDVQLQPASTAAEG